MRVKDETTTAWSPEPWTVVAPKRIGGHFAAGDAYRIRTEVRVEDNWRGYVAEVSAASPNARANAALIAAAPDMYAALVRLMRQPTMSPLKMTPDERAELWAAHEQARAALDRATPEKE